MNLDFCGVDVVLYDLDEIFFMGKRNRTRRIFPRICRNRG